MLPAHHKPIPCTYDATNRTEKRALFRPSTHSLLLCRLVGPNIFSFNVNGAGQLAKKYRVRLTEEERSYLESLVHKGKVAAHKRLHAEILLKADSSAWGDQWQDSQISEAFGISTRTVERVRQRLVQEGLESALERAKPSRVRNRVIDGENEAHLVALACSDAPDGYSRWTLRLLGQRMVELGYVESVSHETIRQTLKKMN